MEELFAVQARIPLLANLAPGALAVERMGGLTNLVFKVDSGAERLVLCSYHDALSLSRRSGMRSDTGSSELPLRSREGGERRP